MRPRRRRPASPCSTATPPFPLPFFVKPVVGRLSQSAYASTIRRGVLALHEVDRVHERYAEIAALAGADPRRSTASSPRSSLVGSEVTLEGYVHDGEVTTIGVTDSVKYPGTLSFERFEYPSALPQERQAELADVAAALLPALGLRRRVLQHRVLRPRDGPAQIIEVNARIASQFAPLVGACTAARRYDALLRARARGGSRAGTAGAPAAWP